MRILHTSDWHLGQHFMGKTRAREHKSFLNWLAKEIDTRKVDALVVAGDIFDTGTPPSYARAFYNEFIVSLQSTTCSQVLILGGNHDAAATLNEARSLLECLNTRVVAGILPEPKDHVMVFNNHEGKPGLIVCAIPFLRPADLVRSAKDQTSKDKKVAIADAIKQFYLKVYDIGKKEQVRLEAQEGTIPIMATGHLTVVGTKSSESVRDIYIGSLDAFPAGSFPLADYLALGHLHRGQRVKDCEHIRYSGSPIPLSFDEGNHPKQVLQVDFDSNGLEQITPVEVPVFRTLMSVKGDLDSIGDKLKELKNKSSGGETQIWLEAEVTAEHYLADLQDRLQDLINDIFSDTLPPELLRVRRKRNSSEHDTSTQIEERLDELTPKEVFNRRLSTEDLTEDRTAALNLMFDEILDQIVTRVPGKPELAEKSGSEKEVREESL